jgi:hypothetical protein
VLLYCGAQGVVLPSSAQTAVAESSSALCSSLNLSCLRNTSRNTCNRTLTGARLRRSLQIVITRRHAEACLGRHLLQSVSCALLVYQATILNWHCGCVQHVLCFRILALQLHVACAASFHLQVARCAMAAPRTHLAHTANMSPES